MGWLLALNAFVAAALAFVVSDLAGLVAGPDWRTAHAAGRAPWTDRWSDLLGALRRD